jgi:hypothetical protein
MSPEKRRLVEDLRRDSASARRDATLREGGRILRRRRWQRGATRGLVLAGILGILAFRWHTVLSPQPAPVAVARTLVPAPASSPRSLTDQELLALFPETPVGLVTLDNGRKCLIFPRPGDEARFVHRL